MRGSPGWVARNRKAIAGGTAAAVLAFGKGLGDGSLSFPDVLLTGAAFVGGFVATWVTPANEKANSET